MIDEDEYPTDPRLGDIEGIVDDKLARIRLGVYSEEMDGTLQGVLEEIEGILR